MRVRTSTYHTLTRVSIVEYKQILDTKRKGS